MHKQMMQQRPRGSHSDAMAPIIKRPEQEYRSLVKYLDRPTQEIVEDIRGRKMLEYDFGSTGTDIYIHFLQIFMYNVHCMCTGFVCISYIHAYIHTYILCVCACVCGVCVCACMCVCAPCTM